jgi:hypothetical protein
MSEPRQIAVPTSGRAYEAACAALRARCEEVGMSRVMLETAAGLPEHNAAKLLAPVPDKRMMAETLLRMLDAVELDIVLIPRPGAKERIADLYGKRAESHVRTTNLRTVLRIKKKARLERIFNDPNFHKKIGRAGGRARAKRQTPEERRKSAIWANRVRWKRQKAKKTKRVITVNEVCAVIEQAR